MWGLKPKKTYCQNICVGFRVIKDTLFEWLKMGKTCLTVSDRTWSFGIKVGPGSLQWDCLVQSSETFLRLPTSCQQTRIICNFLSLVESIQNIRDAAIKVGKAFLNWVIRGFLQNSATNPMRTSHTRGRINQVDVKVGRENLKLAFSAVCHYAPLARTLHAWNPPRNEWWIHYHTSLPFTREQSMVHPPE